MNGKTEEKINNAHENRDEEKQNKTICKKAQKRTIKQL